MAEKNIKAFKDIHFYLARHKNIRQLKNTYVPDNHGHKIWNGALLMIEYLSKQKDLKKSRILEIGCGWGLTGIYCAKQFSAKVKAVDADEDVFPFLQHHAELNSVQLSTEKLKYQQLTKNHFNQIDFVIGSEVCYEDELIKPIFNLSKRALSTGVRSVLVSDIGRPAFHELCELCQEKMDAEVESVEIVQNKIRTSGFVLKINGLG